MIKTFSEFKRMKKMRILNFNTRFGGEKRTYKIVDYLLNNEFDLIILTEFIKNDNGSEIIEKLISKGYKTQPSNNKGDLRPFIASKKSVVVKAVEDRWVEVYVPEMDLHVLGVYVPSSETGKDLFWKKILDYAGNNSDKQVMITGDFNTDNSSTDQTGSDSNLGKLEGLGYLNLWKYNSINEMKPYPVEKPNDDGFKLDHAFISSGLAAILEDVSIYPDAKIRKTKSSDNSPLVVI